MRFSTKTNFQDFPHQGFPRGGVIVYQRWKETLIFGFGKNSLIGQLGDFGGGIKKRDASLIDGALREYREESLNVFGSVDLDRDDHLIASDEHQQLIIFLKVAVDPLIIHGRFENRLTKQSECSEIVWLSVDSLFKLLMNDPQSILYPKIREFLKDCGNFLEYLN